MPKDGEEKKVEASLVFVWQEGDASVGINEGWCFVGVEVEGTKKLLEVDSTVVPAPGGSRRVAYVFDQAATREIDSYSEHEYDDEPEP